MRNRTVIRVLSICAAAALLSGSFIAQAKGENVTLTQLRSQVPERLQMTVRTEAGNTVSVDAEVILPDTDTLPVLQCRQQTFDTRALYEVYPLEKGTATYQTYHGAEISEKAPYLDCVRESKGYLLHGKTDSTTRSPLPTGSTPAMNDYTPEEAVAFIYQNIALFGGDADVDLRLNHVVAMSGLCHMKSAMITEGNASFRAIVADSDRPVKGCEKGLWKIELAQYINDARVFPNPTLDDDENHPSAFLGCPVFSENTIMDEDNFQIFMDCLSVDGVLSASPTLCDWDTLVATIRDQIAQDRLKCVYRVELGYTVAYVPADADLYYDNDNSNDCEIRYVLVPGWVVMGYVRTQYTDQAFDTTEYDAATVLQNGYGYNFRIEDCRLRLTGDTGAPVTYADLLYDLDE